MKIALLLFGQPRFVDSPAVIQSYRDHLLNKYDTDVYAHAWYEPDATYNCSSWSSLSAVKGNDNALDVIQEAYSPKALAHAPPRPFVMSEQAAAHLDAQFPIDHWTKNRSNVLSQLCSIQTVARLVENPEQYDFIILGRYDATLHNFPNLEDLSPDRFYLQNNHPKMPDMIQIFGPQFFPWVANLYDDAEVVYNNLIEPSPEGFKLAAYARRFPLETLAPHIMRAEAVRS